MTTDKNLEQFEKWYNEYDENYIDINHLQFEMQIGVYLAYYDSLDYYIDVSSFLNCKDYFRFKINGSMQYDKESLSSRNEAYKEAFKKANDLINKG